MNKGFVFIFFSFFLFTQCASENPDIRVVCESMPRGNFLIKWETFPPIEGTVKIFESSAPDSFNMFSPIAEVEINKGFKEIFSVKTNKRSYFQLVFNRTCAVVTAERTVPMQGLFNFRDLGGYYNTNGKQSKWGKLYRSSSLSNATFQDARTLRTLGIKTVIDLRTDSERLDNPLRYLAPQTFNFPLRGIPITNYFNKIQSKEMKIGDVKVNAQDMLTFLLEKNSDFFIKMFDILLDAGNYPVLINCSSGSDRSAVAAALILAALDIEFDQIIKDYMLTNESIEFSPYIPNQSIFLQDTEMQEIFTAQFKVHKGTITYPFNRLLKEYGSLENYFNSDLKLTSKKREKLKEIMLY